MIIVAGAVAIIAVIIIAVVLTRRERQGPGLHRRRDALTAWAGDGYAVSDDTIAGDTGYGYADTPAADEDERFTQFLATMERPDGIAREPEPVPPLFHEEYLHTAPLAAGAALDEFMAVPEAPAPASPRRVPGRVLRMGRARAEYLIRPSSLAPAIGAVGLLAAMAQQVAANEHREIRRLQAEVGELGDEILLLRNRIDYPHLADPLFGDWVTGEFPAVIEAMGREPVPA